jgi:hypothetical protein
VDVPLPLKPCYHAEQGRLAALESKVAGQWRNS